MSSKLISSLKKKIIFLYFQNDLFIDCYSEDENDYYTDSEDDEFEEILEETNHPEEDKKGLNNIN